MTEIERPGSFYLGKQVVPETGAMGEAIQYDPRDLTTHAVCVGMTGSGKTGLCIDLLEEAALQGIPSIIIDPKGDITNLLLTFPDLQPADFLPWINVDDARRKNMSEQEFAAYTAKSWSDGLAQWGEGPERIRRLKAAADFVIYTPGSNAGARVSIMQTFAAPDLSWDDNEEALREKIAGTVAALLGLAGIEAESLQSREHVLLANLFEASWRAGEDLDLAKLILQIQKPPVRKLGVFDVDTYFPPADRMKLAMALNNMLASPSFQSWIEGDALDLGQMVRAPDGRPRVSIFYVAHLSDTERMFFITLLLGQVQTWMRTLPGTTSLRGIVYFDEVFGYFPPYPANPPSKTPLLTLLKQARAFGLGIVLVTQNPVDLDYKGLTNAGTWFIGKLQTDRDKMRVLEGLETVSNQAGGAFDRSYFDRLIGGLQSRWFVLHNVHGQGPVVFSSRWALSYLRGPLTRDQVRVLMKTRAATAGPSVAGPAGIQEAAPRTTEDAAAAVAPSLSAKINQYFLPLALRQDQALRQAGAAAGAALVYQPVALGLATVRYAHAASGTDVQQQIGYLLPADNIGAFADWAQAQAIKLAPGDVSGQGSAPARYDEVPAALAEPARMKTMQKDLLDFLYRNLRLVVSHSPKLDLYARPSESDRDFKLRLQDAARSARDDEIEKLRAKAEPKIEKLKDRLSKAELDLDAQRQEYQGRKREELLSAGESILGLFIGRRSTRSLSTASRRRRMTQSAGADIKEHEQSVEDLDAQIKAAEEELKAAVDEINTRWSDAADEIEEVRVTPKKTDIDLEVFGLGWAPAWEVELTDAAGAAQRRRVPAFAAE